MSNRSDSSQQPSSEFFLEIRRARLSRLIVYDVSESELEILERGSPDSLFLNFSVFLISSAISFTISLLTTNFPTQSVFTVFVVFTIIGYVGGIFLLLLWRRNHTSVKNCVETIRRRLPPEGVQQPLDVDDGNSGQA